jgi:hypothetical protein
MAGMLVHLKISKIDAAKRQLETAIRLYFNEADPVSIHTLTGAAHEILSDLNSKVSGTPMILSDVLVKEERKKEFRQIMNEAKNHFKHADKDSDTVIDFNPEINETFIYDACAKYEQLTGEAVPYFRIYCGWFVSGHLQIFDYDASIAKFEMLRRTYKSKTEYFSAMASATCKF